MKAYLAPLLFALGGASLAVAAMRGCGGAALLASGSYGATRVEGSGFPKTLTNGAAKRTIPSPPKRIASLTVTADEILLHLVDPTRLAAVTHFADDPIIEPSAGLAPKTAARIRGVDPESILALAPDVVFVAHYTLESAVRILNSASIPVVRLRETHSYEDVATNVRSAAAVVGEEARGKAVIAELSARIEGIAKRVAGLRAPRVLYYSAVGYTAGSQTLVDEKIRLAGARNVAAEASLVGFKNVTMDVLVGLDPEVIVVPKWTEDGGAAVRDVMESAAFKNVDAVRHGRVYAFAASLLTSESPAGVAGVEALARLLHPEAFPS